MMVRKCINKTKATSKKASQKREAERTKYEKDKAIAELNALSLCLYGEKESVVKIFDFVTYERGKYIFEFTSEALPYYDMGYAILNMLEANMK